MSNLSRFRSKIGTSTADIGFYADWSAILNLSGDLFRDAGVILECDRLTSSIAIGAYGISYANHYLIPSEDYLCEIESVGLSLSRDTSERFGETGTLGIGGHDLCAYLDPLARDSIPYRRIRTLGELLSGLRNCSGIILGGAAADARVISNIQNVLPKRRPSLIFRSPKTEMALREIGNAIASIGGYRWLSEEEIRLPATAGATVERIAICVDADVPAGIVQMRPIEAPRSILSDISPDSPKTFIRRSSNTPRRPYRAVISIKDVPAGSGFHDIERDGELYWRWGGNGPHIKMLIEVPWPGNYDVSASFHFGSTAKISEFRVMVNGREERVMGEGDPLHRIKFHAPLFRHGLIHIHCPPLAHAHDDVRNLTVAMSHIEIQETPPS
jgi:hypothetical protein